MLFSNHTIQNWPTSPRFNAMCHSDVKAAIISSGNIQKWEIQRLVYWISTEIWPVCFSHHASCPESHSELVIYTISVTRIGENHIKVIWNPTGRRRHLKDLSKVSLPEIWKVAILKNPRTISIYIYIWTINNFKLPIFRKCYSQKQEKTLNGNKPNQKYKEKLYVGILKTWIKKWIYLNIYSCKVRRLIIYRYQLPQISIKFCSIYQGNYFNLKRIL